MPIIRYRAIVDKSFHSVSEWAISQNRICDHPVQVRNGLEDLHVIRTSPQIEPLLDPYTYRPESMQIIRLLHQGPAPPWRRSPSWTASCAPPGLMNHGHRHASHERIHNMAVSKDVGRDLPPGELLPARDLLDPGLHRQADKLERDVEEDGNRIAQDMYKMRSFAVELHRECRLSLGKPSSCPGPGASGRC